MEEEKTEGPLKARETILGLRALCKEDSTGKSDLQPLRKTVASYKDKSQKRPPPSFLGKRVYVTHIMSLVRPSIPTLPPPAASVPSLSYRYRARDARPGAACRHEFSGGPSPPQRSPSPIVVVPHLSASPMRRTPPASLTAVFLLIRCFCFLDKMIKSFEEYLDLVSYLYYGHVPSQAAAREEECEEQEGKAAFRLTTLDHMLSPMRADLVFGTMQQSIYDSGREVESQGDRAVRVRHLQVWQRLRPDS